MARYFQGVLVCLALFCALPAQAALKVVATVPDLAALASEIGGDAVNVTVLSRADENPHYVDPRPSLVVALSRADVLFLNGMDLEIGWLPPLLVNARNAVIQLGAPGYFDASKYVKRLEVPESVDRALGDIHPAGNPHYTFDPRSAAVLAKAMGERLAGLDPERTDLYRGNAKRIADELNEIAQKERARFDAIGADKRRVVTYHRSLVYLLEWLGIERPINVEPKPGVAPSPSHVARVLATMRAQKIKVILQERFYPTKTSETLARLAGAEVVIVPGAADFKGGERYAQRIRRTVEAIYVALSR